MDVRLKFPPIILFLIFVVVGVSFGAAEIEGRYRVDISVPTQGWAYPDEETTIQVITFLDKYQPPPPGEPPTPLSPGDWVNIGDVPLRFDVKDEAGNSVNLNIPQGLKTDNNGFLEMTFKAPSREGKYTMSVYAVIEGVECSDSEEFTVSAEERILPTVAPTPTPTPSPTPTYITPLILVLIVSAAVVVALSAFVVRRGKERGGKKWNQKAGLMAVAVIVIVIITGAAIYVTTQPSAPPASTPEPTPIPGIQLEVFDLKVYTDGTVSFAVRLHEYESQILEEVWVNDLRYSWSDGSTENATIFRDETKTWRMDVGSFALGESIHVVVRGTIESGGGYAVAEAPPT